LTLQKDPPKQQNAHRYRQAVFHIIRPPSRRGRTPNQ
jgi:hypothetical protein